MQVKFINDVINGKKKCMASQCSDSCEKTSMIRGHHIYKFIWTPIIRKELVLEAQDNNKKECGSI